MQNIRLAVIGLGKMGFLHASILNTMPDVKIVALCDKSSVLLRIAQKLFKKAKMVNDITKLTDLNINSVYVTTPIPTHFTIISSLLSKSLIQNIFVEKTLASSWDMATELCKLAENLKGTDMVGYMKRYSVTFRKAKNLLTQEFIGKISSFHAYAYSSDFSNINQGSKKTSIRGGVLRDLGSHVIDLATWFFGEFKIDSASIESIIDESTEDVANVDVSKHNLKGKFAISWCAENYRMPSFGFAIVGNKGTMKVDDYSIDINLNNGKNLRWFKHDLVDSVNFLLGDPEYYREDEAFIKSIISGEKIEPSFKTASITDYVIDQIKKEAKIDK